MTKQELADLIGVSRPTLNQWEKDKPYLIKLINLGLKAENTIKETKEIIKKFEELEKNASIGKLQLK
jgi:DNA-binding XRE family transcriptional regulator